MPIELSKIVREEAIASIQTFSQDIMDERMGNIVAGTLLDFFLEEIAPCVYNKAVTDVQKRMQARLMDIDAELHEEEFVYSRRHGRKRRRS